MKLSEDEICNVLEALIGNTHAQGETTADDKAFERLKVLESVTDWCMDGFIYEIPLANRNEWSMSRFGKEAIRYLRDLYGWIGERLSEEEKGNR